MQNPADENSIGIRPVDDYVFRLFDASVSPPDLIASAT